MLGAMQILGFPLGVIQILAFLDDNMLVSPMQNSHVRGIGKRNGPTQVLWTTPAVSVFTSQWNIGSRHVTYRI